MVSTTTADRPKCQYEPCGKPLKRAAKDCRAKTGLEYGLYADNTFCAATCGYLWACEKLNASSALKGSQ